MTGSYQEFVMYPQRGIDLLRSQLYVIIFPCVGKRWKIGGQKLKSARRGGTG
jgi:hypothetical protein